MDEKTRYELLDKMRMASAMRYHRLHQLCERCNDRSPRDCPFRLENRYGGESLTCAEMGYLKESIDDYANAIIAYWEAKLEEREGKGK